MKKLMLIFIFFVFFVCGYFLGFNHREGFSIKQEIVYLSKSVNLLDDYRIGSVTNLEQAVEMEVVESVYTIGLLLSKNENLLDSTDKAALDVVFKIVPILNHPETIKDVQFMPIQNKDALINEINRVRTVVTSH